MIAVTVAAMVAAMVAAPAAAAAAAAPTGQPAGRGFLFDQQVLYLVNQARQQVGAPVLHSDSGLAYLASWWSYREAHGATGGQVAHNLNAPSMLADVGAGDWSAWAENVAVFGPSKTPRQAFDDYMASPVHRNNILNPRYRYFGSGTTITPDGKTVFNTMEFTDTVDAGGCHPFPDVDATSVHCRNISWLSGQGITSPIGGNYHPYLPVNRGAMAAFLFRLTHPHTPSPVCHAKPFPDVAVGSTFCGYIQWARSAHIVVGYSDGMYGPDRPVTRGAMAAYLHRLVTGLPASECTGRPFPDVAVGSTFCGVIAWAKSAGVTTGTDSGGYGTQSAVTRQSMASFLRRTAALL